MNDETREALEQELLELRFDCHPDPDALRRRIAEEPELAALWQRVQADAELLERAARVDDTGFEPRIPRPFWRRPWFPVQLAAAACLVSASYFGLCAWDLHAQRKRSIDVTAKTRTSVPDGRPFAIEVTARDGYGESTDCPVEFAILDADGTPIRKGRTTTNGEPINAPASLPGARRVVLNTTTPDGIRELTIPLDPSAAIPLVHVETDKPIYRPGETMRFRAVALDRVGLTAMTSTEPLQFRVLDAHDATVATFWQYGRFGAETHGVGWDAWSIPEEIPGGKYRVEVVEARTDLVADEQEVTIRRFQPPRLESAITLDRASYAPGSAGTAEIVVRRLAGDVASGAMVEATVVVDGEPVWREVTSLDARGRTRVAFTIPDDVERGDARLFAKVTDGGTIETAVEPFVVPTGALSIHAYPEGGELVAGLPTRTYLEITDSLDRPVSARGRILDSKRTPVAEFRTVHAGRVAVEFTPEIGERYTCELVDPRELSIDLPDVIADGVALRSVDQVSRAGEPLRLRVGGRAERNLTVGVFCRGTCVASTRVTGFGLQDVALDVPEAVFGVLRVTVFDDGFRPVAERLVQRAPSRTIRITLDPQRTELEPGARQHVALRTVDETGRPVAAAVGIAVTDHAVLALDGEPRVGIVDRVALLGDVAVPRDLADYLVQAEGQPERIDLLLGTRGWRKFVWAPSADEIASAAGVDLDRVRPLEGLALRADEVRAPAVATSALPEARRALRRGRTAFTATLALSVLGLALWFGALGAARIARRLEWTGSWRGDLLAGTSAVAAIATVLLVALPTVIERVAPPAVRAMLGEGDDAAGLGIWEGELKAGLDFDFGDVVVEETEIAEAPEPVAEAAPVANPLDPAEDPLIAGDDSYGRPESQRVYAHAHDPVGERVDFTENVYWNALLVTDDDGRAGVEFDVSDRVTTWDVFANAHGWGRVGQAAASFDTELPFFLDVSVPNELTEGDRVDLPVALVADPKFATEAELRFQVSGDLRTDGSDRLLANLDDTGRGSARISLEATANTDARTRISILGAAGRFRDRVSHPVRVVPRGFPHRRSWAGTADRNGRTFTLPLPATMREGSARVMLRVFPSPLASLREGLEGILQEPHGCFEQASSSNYPNTMVLAYVEASGDDIPSVTARARELLPKGYAKIAGYECSERGYEWFGANPGHEALTAYGLLQFEDMARVFDVDRSMVDRTRQWLLGRRDGNGGFARNPAALDSFGGAPDSVTDAYIVYALLYAGQDPATLHAEIARLESRVTTDDAYELAVIACALGRTDSAAASVARERLTSLQRADGSLCGSTSSVTRSGERDLTVETTAFAVLAWLDEPERHGGRIEQACQFLQTQQTARGTFGATQATIMALKALTAHATATRKLPEHGRIDVYVDDAHVASEPFAATDP
ncbi:MAG: hypothetical protein KDB80_07295, partial [Planctomycetes bacterium]|nr:hypothetical protein [Planctomycetota bacterium]